MTLTQNAFDLVVETIERDGSVSREDLPDDVDVSVLDELCDLGWLEETEPGVWRKGWKANMFSGAGENQTSVEAEEPE